jgi:hypothetical protein
MTTIDNNGNNFENDSIKESSSDAANDRTQGAEYWDRLPEEPGKAWFAFQTYLYLGPTRSLSKVVRELVAKRSYTKQLERWSRQYSWVDRAEAWDRHIDETRQKEYIGAIKEMAQRQAQLGRELQDKAREALQKLDVSTLKPAEVAKLLDLGVKIERSSWKIKEGLSPINPVWYAHLFNDNKDDDDDEKGHIYFEPTPEIKNIIEQIEELIRRHEGPGVTDVDWREPYTPMDPEMIFLQNKLLQLIAEQQQKEFDDEVDE